MIGARGGGKFFPLYIGIYLKDILLPFKELYKFCMTPEVEIALGSGDCFLGSDDCGTTV